MLQKHLIYSYLPDQIWDQSAHSIPDGQISSWHVALAMLCDTNFVNSVCRRQYWEVQWRGGLLCQNLQE